MLAVKPALVRLLFIFCAVLSGCPEHEKVVVVNVLLVGNGTAYRAISPRFIELGKGDMRTHSGRPVMAQEILVRVDDMQRFVEKVRPSNSASPVRHARSRWLAVDRWPTEYCHLDLYLSYPRHC